MPKILALDPGNALTAWVVFDPASGRLLGFGHDPNEKMLRMIVDSPTQGYREIGAHLAIEMIASYGMPVGREVFDTCVWIGRFVQAWGSEHTRVYRAEVKSHLCHSQKANDATIRAALLDRYGPGREKAIGVKKAPGPLYGVSGDVWAALAVAVTYSDTHK